jgi:hypothetical protein
MLNELGSNADEVAATLRRLGIQGVRNTVRFLNPIVRYANTQVAGAYGIDLIQVDRLRIVFADGRMEEIAVPEAVLRFLDNFHQGLYPDLEMPLGPG